MTHPAPGLILELFAGCGGASEGIVRALTADAQGAML